MSFGYLASIGSNALAAGEKQAIWLPRTPRVNTYPVVFCHGAAAPTEFLDNSAQSNSVILAAELARIGFSCVAGDFGFDTWGSDTVVSRIDAAPALLSPFVPNLKTGKVLLVGVSMGFSAVARYIEQYPSKVAAAIGIIPFLDVPGEYANNTNGFRASIGTAWGVTYPTPLPGRADLQANAYKAAGVPMLLGYSTVDVMATPANVLAFAASTGAKTYVVDTAAGHSNAAVGGLPLALAAQFLGAHA